MRKSKPSLSGSRQERIIGASQSAQNGRSLVAFSWKNEGTERLSIIRFPCLGGSATLSVTDRCRDGAVMEPGWNLSSAAAGQYCSLPQIKISYPQHNLSRSILIFQTSFCATFKGAHYHPEPPSRTSNTSNLTARGLIRSSDGRFPVRVAALIISGLSSVAAAGSCRRAVKFECYDPTVSLMPLAGFP